MVTFNKALFLSNVAFLAKKKGIKIGELETTADVSIGYLSRLRNEKSIPSITVVSSIADQLGVPIDAIISIDFEATTENDLYMMQFVETLSNNTRKGALKWNIETSVYLNSFEFDGSYNPHHPLFEVGPDSNMDPELYYVSRFHLGTPLEFSGNSFNAMIADQTFIYLMNVKRARSRINPSSDYELYLVKYENQKKNVSPLCCGRRDDTFLENSLFPYLENLYRAINDARQQVKLSDDIKNILDSYMNTKQS